MNNLAAAMAYAERLDAAVIPTGMACKPGSVAKWWDVADGESSHFAAFDGTKDPAVIRKIWTRYPAANVSMVTGAISGFFVLDIDRHGHDGFESLAALEAEHGALPPTWRALTPSSGEHRYFRQPDGWGLRNKVGLRTYDSRGRVLAKYLGLDIRTTNAAIAAPPSRKPNGPYVWADKPSDLALADAPFWLLKMCLDPPVPAKPDRAPLRKDTAARMARYVEAALDGECGAVAKTARGAGRNQRLFTAAIRLGELIGAKLLPQDLAEGELERAAADCGLAGDDGYHSVRATIRSGITKGIANPREVAS